MMFYSVCFLVSSVNLGVDNPNAEWGDKDYNIVCDALTR